MVASAITRAPATPAQYMALHSVKGFRCARLCLPLTLLRAVLTVSGPKGGFYDGWEGSAKWLDKHFPFIAVVVWGVPLLIIVTLATIVWKSTHELDPYRPLDVPGQPINVEVIATDWKWIFIYPDFGIATINQLVFPAHRQVALSITSNSTMGTFFIPQLGGQIYAMPGMRTQLHLMANEEGKFRGMSGNFNGPGFSDMTFIATATSEDGFQRWVKQVRTSPNTLDFNTFQKVAKPSQGNGIAQFSQVQPGLFKSVIDQYVGLGADTAARAALDVSPSSKREE